MIGSEVFWPMVGVFGVIILAIMLEVCCKANKCCKKDKDQDYKKSPNEPEEEKASKNQTHKHF
jgi:hypothetical protein